MPFIKVYIHFVWSTKNRIPFLETPEIRKEMWKHIKENGEKKGIFIDFVNGYNDHCHCLVSLGNEQTISKVVQLIKGESAFWFNNQKLILDKFEWQNEYFAVSVSESVIEKVRNYIKNQELHHKTKSFQDEYQELIDKFGFQKFLDNK
ncbi:IS200/IS605 family transposase [Flavobacterium sp. PLA-1-15]|uniref:IS200/IS605 family transposase n=1 Tax=Flavobacterium sp. PLA-1-15 TaxID=3380533 RepID=UPI003B78AA4F